MVTVNLNTLLTIDSYDEKEINSIIERFNEFMTTQGGIDGKIVKITPLYEKTEKIINYMKGKKKIETFDYVLEYTKMEAVKISSKNDTSGTKPEIIKTMDDFYRMVKKLSEADKPMLYVCDVTGQPMQEGYINHNGSWKCSKTAFPSYMNKRVGSNMWKEEENEILIKVNDNWQEAGIKKLVFDREIEVEKKAKKIYEKIAGIKPREKNSFNEIINSKKNIVR